MSQRPFDMERLSLAPPLAWAIGVAAIMSVFALVAIIVNYAPLNRASDRRIETDLPPATFDSVGALIKATGNACPQVCSIAPVPSLAETSMLDVACADGGPHTCAAPVHYRLSVEDAAGAH